MLTAAHLQTVNKALDLLTDKYEESGTHTDNTDLVRETREQINALQVRLVDKDNPETWPPETGSLIACWRKAGLRPVIITALDAYCRERLTDGTFIAWMPLPIVPGA